MPACYKYKAGIIIGGGKKNRKSFIISEKILSSITITVGHIDFIVVSLPQFLFPTLDVRAFFSNVRGTLLPIGEGCRRAGGFFGFSNQ